MAQETKKPLQRIGRVVMDLDGSPLTPRNEAYPGPHKLTKLLLQGAYVNVHRNGSCPPPALRHCGEPFRFPYRQPTRHHIPR